MTVLITMAGMGSRFRERGYLPPKFRIMARGRTLMEWSLCSLNAFFAEPFIFACLDEEDGGWIQSTAAALGIAEVAIAKRSGVSRGQAETAFDALANVDLSQPLWIYNIDTCVSPNAMRPQDLRMAAGCVPAFYCTEANMSFLRYSSGNDVIEVAEKQPISTWATIGLYGFISAELFAESYKEAYERGRIRNVHGEHYVAPIYELLITHGERVIAPRIENDDVHILGTPAQLLTFDPAALPPFGNDIPMQ